MELIDSIYLLLKTPKNLVLVGWTASPTSSTRNELCSVLWFAPRKPGTGCSRPDKLRIERMTQAGLMMQAGLEKVAQAKRDGFWSKLDAVEDLEVPADLDHALSRYPAAASNFAGFPGSAKRAILEWIADAKTPDTRGKRLVETARLASDNVRANQWRPKPANQSGFAPLQ
jgi:hypothetical protein